MTKLPTLDDLRKLADELENKMHLAGSAVRERWNQQVRPKLVELDKKLEEKGQRAGEVIQAQVTTLGNALEQLRRELAEDLKIGKKADDKPDDKTGA